jgi:hypothetical protein
MSLCLCNRIYTIKSLDPVIVEEGKSAFINSYLSKRSTFRVAKNNWGSGRRRFCFFLFVCVSSNGNKFYVFTYIPRVHHRV